jgi:hypothetical protein
MDKMTVVSGSKFDSGVLAPGPLVPDTAPPKRELQDQFMTALTRLNYEAQLTREDRAEIQLLVVARMAANARAEKLIARVVERMQVAIVAEHERAKRDVLEQQRLVQEHQDKILHLQQTLNRKRELESEAVGVFHGVQARKRQMSRFSSRAEINDINKELAAAEGKVAAASEQVGLLLSMINDMTLTGLQPLVTKLNELVADEVRLPHAVYGKSYTTAEGIVVPPSDGVPAELHQG